MSLLILKTEVKYENDIVLARQRARLIARLLGFDKNEQTRISTAVSEIARNAHAYAGVGETVFLIEGNSKPQVLIVQINDEGPGIEDVSAILEGRLQSKTGMGIMSARRLMDYFHVESKPGKGTQVILGKTVPQSTPLINSESLSRIADELTRQPPHNPFEELQQQNQELIRAMSELKQRQDQLENLNKELEDTNRGIVALYGELDEKAAHLVRASDLKTRFLSNMSHELRTPINSILSLSRLLLEHVDGELASEQEKQVMFIKNGAEDLSEIINDLLDIAKIEAGKVEVHSAEFDVATLFSTLRGMLKPMLTNTAVDLIIDEPESMPTMKSDEGKISQILRNLVSNAIKFTEQGEIRVRAKLDADGKNVIFSVSDTGIGIPSEYHEKIFEEYTQVKTPLHKKSKGTGLGLPLSKELAGLLGGKIFVQSTPGEGSAFSAVVPLVCSGFTGKIQKQAVVDFTKFSVLVIEHDEEILFLYDKFLKGSGFQLFPARNLSEARQSLTEFTPLVIVLDILLKDESGWDFIAELKSNDETREIPIIVATILDDRERGFTLGIEDFATKPIERKWLLAKLKDLAQDVPVEKVLVVDDEEVARHILKGILVDTKYTVMEAPGGEECLKIAQTERPDIIFLDLMMPGMDGFETLTKLKASPETQDIPVIVVTSKILDEAERYILKKNTLAVISKETTSREVIIESIRDTISRIAHRKNQEGKTNNA